MSVILEMKNIEKSFPGVKALKDMNLVLNDGEILAVLGENGAGKSTLMKVLTGIYKAEKGKIFVFGEEVDFRNYKNAQKKGISIIFQELSLIPYFNAWENIFLGNELLKFNLFIDVEYGDVNGVTQPTNIYVYAYQFKNLFVNLYAQTSDIKYYTGNYSDLGQTNNYVVTAACYMRIQDINQGDLLSSDMVIDKYTYNVIDAATGAVNASETGETETLGEYVSRLQSSNKCLQELTTGRYITTNTLNGNDGGFVINKNYAFIVCDMPSSLVS